MEIRKSRHEDLVVLKPEGRIDTHSAHELEEAMVGELNEGTRRFIIDFTSVGYISSAGLRVLLMLAKKLGAEREDLILCSMNEHVREVFDIAGFTSIFNIVPTRAIAMRHLAALAGTPGKRVHQALAILGVKPARGAKLPPTATAAFGCELLIGRSRPPAS